MTMPLTQSQAASALQSGVPVAVSADAAASRDSKAFELMLQSQLGISGDILAKAPLAASEDTAKDPVKALDMAAQRVSGNPGEVRGGVNPGEVRMKVNKGARHPDDLGHLSQIAKGAYPTKGFTRQEEDLLLAAASRETKLTYAGRTMPNSLVGRGAPRLEGGGGGAARAADRQTAKNVPQGKLCAKYESNCDAAAIGYDSKGGTSYGLYQIASNTGTMDRFLKFLDAKAPDIAKTLAEAGPANTGSKDGAMPEAWRKIAADQGKRFEALQHEFIRESHYEPATKNIATASGLDVKESSHALREVLWSTAVQHGPSGATEIFNAALDTVKAKGGTQNFDRAMIDAVYDLRSGQFGGHSGRVRAAVQNRLQNEKQSAMAMLERSRPA